MPIIRNMSDHNIIINEKVVLPTRTIVVSNEQLEDLQKLIDNGMLKHEQQTVHRIETTISNDNIKQFDSIKERILPALFSLHFNQDLTIEQLHDLKWFFKNVGPTSQLDNNLKLLLDDVNHTEEFLEVLLNHLYPELIKNYLK